MFSRFPEIDSSLPCAALPGRAMSFLRRTLLRVPGLLRAKQRLEAKGRLLRVFPRNAVGVEIGVHEGDYAERILRAARPRQLHLVDPWRFFEEARYAEAIYGGRAGSQAVMDARFEAVSQRFRGEIESGRVVVHRATCEDFGARYRGEVLDFAYIDGDHSFEGVSADLRTLVPLLRPGGIVAGDDYGVSGWWEQGVTRAVDAWIAEHPGTHLQRLGSQYWFLRPET